MTSALLRLLIVAPFAVLIAAVFAACLALERFADVRRPARSRRVGTPGAARPQRLASLSRS
jgi:hypothetical protein